MSKRNESNNVKKESLEETRTEKPRKEGKTNKSGRSKSKSKNDRDNSTSSSTSNTIGGVPITFPQSPNETNLGLYSFREILGVREGYDSVYINDPLVCRFMLNSGICPTGDRQGPYAKSIDGVNLASLDTYTKINATTGRTGTYTPAAISMMILEMGEVLKLISYIRRAMGLVYYYNSRNYSVPQTLFTALGFTDFSTSLKGLSDYRTRFNTLLQQLGSIPIIDIPYLRNCATLFDNVYADAPNDYAQLYIFTWGYLWEYNEENNKMEVKSFTTHTETFDSLLDYLDTRINKLKRTSHFQVVYQDLINISFKLGLKFLVVDLMPVDYFVAPIYNELALLQIHNMSILGSPTDITNTNEVYENTQTGYITYDPLWEVTTTTEERHVGKTLLNFPALPDQNVFLQSLVFTGLHSAFTASGTGLYSSGTVFYNSYVSRANIFYLSDSGVMSLAIDSGHGLDWHALTIEKMHLIVAATRFKYHPKFRITSVNESNQMIQVDDLFDLEVHTLMDWSKLRDIMSDLTYNSFKL